MNESMMLDDDPVLALFSPCSFRFSFSFVDFILLVVRGSQPSAPFSSFPFFIEPSLPSLLLVLPFVHNSFF
ncbi:MAG: hypothetical protein JOS17DRAFT_736587 [Linnemannia elongata]|nr:MAG: hypothetical protein JOS17DRAFT_736587 [Linnemannia elongata]